MQLAWWQTSPSGQPMTPMVPSGTSQRLLVVVMLMCDRSCRESSQHWMRCSTETSMFLCYTRTLDWMSFKKNFHVIFLFYFMPPILNLIVFFVLSIIHILPALSLFALSLCSFRGFHATSSTWVKELGTDSTSGFYLESVKRLLRGRHFKENAFSLRFVT